MLLMFEPNENMYSCLQGGPGGSGSGFGNFEEIGPLGRDLKPRETSWVRFMVFNWSIVC